jgi:hypothetical protein
MIFQRMMLGPGIMNNQLWPLVRSEAALCSGSLAVAGHPHAMYRVRCFACLSVCLSGIGFAAVPRPQVTDVSYVPQITSHVGAT